MSYLKALGILRLVSEQADTEATGLWDRDSFVLESILCGEDLLDFFKTRYAPAPILGPWAGGSGFFGHDNRDAVNAIERSVGERLFSYRAAIKSAKHILKTEELLEKPVGEAKARLLRRYRREMPDDFVRWMDAAMVLGENAEWFAPVLGTGGNDGRLDFTQNFMQRIVDLRLHEQTPRPEASTLLRGSLWGEPIAGLGKAAVGQFAPGRVGGPNATQGMEAGSTDNPWDFLFALEGALMLSSAAVRRLGSRGGRASFPFAVGSRPVGVAQSNNEESKEARGELWLPLWGRPSSAQETQLLFSEGRAEVAGRPARDAVDFSRAVVGLGTDRGIQAFCRYGLFKRAGKSFLAVAVGRISVPAARRESVDLLLSLDDWLADYRAHSGANAPQRLQAAMRRIEAKIFDYCSFGLDTDLLGILIAVGAAERELAVTAGQQSGKQMCRPIQELPSAWIDSTNDSTAEFEIALALASVGTSVGHGSSGPAVAFRTHLEPVKRMGRSWMWDEAAPSMVWKSGGLAENTVAALERRLLDAGQSSLCFTRAVSVESIARFLVGETDDRRIDDLLRALSLVRISETNRVSTSSAGTPPSLPRAFAILKPLFLPWAIRFRGNRWQYAQGDPDATGIKSDPRVLSLVRAGRIREACEIASRRMFVSGLMPIVGSARSGLFRRVDKDIEQGVEPTRLAAALLLPVRGDELDRMIGLVVRQPTDTRALEPQGVE